MKQAEPTVVKRDRDQRRSPRFPWSLPVVLMHGTERQVVQTVDVSQHGLFVATDRPPRERFLVTLSIHLPDGPLPATAFVSRGVQGRGTRPGGVGLQLFALGTQEKGRWDRFVQTVGGRRPPPASEEGAGDAPLSQRPVFLLKLRDGARLREFHERNVLTGGLYLATPVIKPVGSELSLVVVHPDTEAEVTLYGYVERVRTDRPKGMEIRLQPALTADQQAAFQRFVETGATPTAEDGTIDIVIEEPEPFDRQPGAVTGEFDWRDVSDELIVDLDLSEYEAEGPIPLAPSRVSEAKAIAREVSSPGLVAPVAGALSADAALVPESRPKSEDLSLDIHVSEDLGPDREDSGPPRPAADPDRTPVGELRAIALPDDAILGAAPPEGAAPGLDRAEVAEDVELPSDPPRVVDLPPPGGAAGSGSPRATPRARSSGVPSLRLSVLGSAAPPAPITTDLTRDAPEPAEPRPEPPEPASGPASEPTAAPLVHAGCAHCGVELGSVRLGDAPGPVGLLARLRPYWCARCERFVSVARLKPSSERRAILWRLGGPRGAALRAPIELGVAFELAHLAGSSPRCPDCGGAARSTSLVRALLDALAKGPLDRAIELDKVLCPECGARSLVITPR